MHSDSFRPPFSQVIDGFDRFHGIKLYLMSFACIAGPDETEKKQKIDKEEKG